MKKQLIAVIAFLTLAQAVAFTSTHAFEIVAHAKEYALPIIEVTAGTISSALCAHIIKNVITRAHARINNPEFSNQSLSVTRQMISIFKNNPRLAGTTLAAGVIGAALICKGIYDFYHHKSINVQ